MPEEQGHVVIAGFGRIGQIVARILQARGIPFTALDGSAEQIDFVTKFGGRAYYGDATRLSILEAAQVGKASAFVLAIGNIEISLKTAELVRRHFPHVPIYARARNRSHVHELMDLGVDVIRRETFLSSLDIHARIVAGLGYPEEEVARTVETFREFDRHHLYGDYAHYTDQQKLQAQAKKRSEELKELFAQDEIELGIGPPGRNIE